MDEKVLKLNSRIGMSFATTAPVWMLHKEQVVSIRDIPSDYKEFPFTDGSGNISMELSDKINEYF